MRLSIHGLLFSLRSSYRPPKYLEPSTQPRYPPTLSISSSLRATSYPFQLHYPTHPQDRATTAAHPPPLLHPTPEPGYSITGGARRPSGPQGRDSSLPFSSSRGRSSLFSRCCCLPPAAATCAVRREPAASSRLTSPHTSSRLPASRSYHV